MSSDPGAWRPRPWAAAGVTALAALLPAAAALTGYAVVLAVGRERWSPLVLALAVLVVTLLSGVLAIAISRRALPLAYLLRLDLVFPEALPSRFRTALRSGSIRSLGHEDLDVELAGSRIVALAAAIARHDRATRGHSERVRAYAEVISEVLGLPREDRERLRWAALLHDVGKLDVPASILAKHGALDEDEWVRVRRHPEIGASLTSPLATFLGPWAATMRQHHERWDGQGYPDGLRGQEISPGARIVAVADAFEVMTGTSRRYRTPDSVEEAKAELVRCAGTQFDPAIVRAFAAVPSAGLLRVMRATAWGLPLPLALVSLVQASGTDLAHAAPLGARLPDVATPPDGATAADHVVHGHHDVDDVGDHGVHDDR